MPGCAPEKSKSFNLGVVLAPLPGLGATLDYYKIELNNQIVSAATSDPNYVPAFVRGAPVQMETVQADGSVKSVLSPVGPILYATSGYINAGKTTTSGIEASINYRFRLPGELGSLRADLSGAHVFNQGLGHVHLITFGEPTGERIFEPAHAALGNAAGQA